MNSHIDKSEFSNGNHSFIHLSLTITFINFQIPTKKTVYQEIQFTVSHNTKKEYRRPSKTEPMCESHSVEQ